MIRKSSKIKTHCFLPNSINCSYYKYSHLLYLFNYVHVYVVQIWNQKGIKRYTFLPEIKPTPPFSASSNALGLR